MSVLNDDEAIAYLDRAVDDFNQTGERLSAAHDLTLTADDEKDILGV